MRRAGSPPQTFPCYGNGLLTLWLFCSQAILNNDETSYELENLDTDTEYDVKVTAIYSDEAESEDLLGITRTCKLAMWRNQILCETNPLKSHIWNHFKLMLLFLF